MHDPKRILSDVLGGEYRETDAPKIMRKAIEHSLIGNELGTNQSYRDFLADVEEMAGHLPDRS